MFELRPYNRNRRNDNNEIYYNPFRAMDEFERRFFGEPWGRNAESFFDNDSTTGFSTDIKDEGDSYLLEADMPGFDKKDIKLDLNGDQLTIRAERHSEHEEKDKQNKYVRCERSYGSYSRSFDMTGIDKNGIRAKYENGVLSLTLPKQQEVLPESRTLEIE